MATSDYLYIKTIGHNDKQYISYIIKYILDISIKEK